MSQRQQDSYEATKSRAQNAWKKHPEFHASPATNDDSSVSPRAAPAAAARGRRAGGARRFRHLLTPDEVARRLKVEASVVRRLIEDGNLPHARIGTEIRVRPESLDTWIAAHEARVVAAPPAGIPDAERGAES